MTERQAPTVRQALAELVACKDLKERADACGYMPAGEAMSEYIAATEEYERRWPLAWSAARSALSAAPDLVERLREWVKVPDPTFAAWNSAIDDMREAAAALESGGAERQECQHEWAGNPPSGMKCRKCGEAHAAYPAVHPAEWVPTGELGDDDSDAADAARFRAIPKMTLAIIWRRPNPLLGDLKDGYDIESLRVWTDAALQSNSSQAIEDACDIKTEEHRP